MDTLGLSSENDDLHWMDQTLPCQSYPELWFSELRSNEMKAIEYCNQCPAISDCLAFIKKHPSRYGIYAGLTPNKRQHLRKIGKL